MRLHLILSLNFAYILQFIKHYYSFVGYKCYHWSAKDQTQIRRLGGSIRSERITCEGYENFVFTQGDDSKACGCGGCYCCQPNNN